MKIMVKGRISIIWSNISLSLIGVKHPCRLGCGKGRKKMTRVFADKLRHLVLFSAAAKTGESGQPYKDWVFINYTFKRFEGELAGSLIYFSVKFSASCVSVAAVKTACSCF